MSQELPEPLVPANCDLQDFKFMPLDVARLRDSDLAAEQTPEENWAAVLLWAASWHQIPAASVPDNDQWLAKQAGYMSRGRIDKAWETVKAGAMRGFVLCSDGRFYHTVVAEKARESWQSKLEQRHRSECGRIKKHNERHHMSLPVPSFDDWMSQGCRTGQPLPVVSDTPPVSQGQSDETGSKRQGQGQGQGQLKGQGQRDLIPEPSGSGGKPRTPADPVKDEIWKTGRELLEGKGESRAAAGSFLGGLVRDFGQKLVLDAVRDAAVSSPIEPKGWLTARCQERRSTNGSKQATLEARNKAVAENWAAQQQENHDATH